MRIRQWWRRFVERQQAQATCDAAERDLTRWHRRLGHTSDPWERADLLERCAQSYDRLATWYQDAHGVVLVDDQARSMTDSLRNTAEIYGLLSCVESRRADGHDHLPALHEVPAAAIVPVDGVAVLRRMADEPVLADRMQLIVALYEAIQPAIGGQAAEAVWCLPWPGRDAWLREHAGL